MKDQSSRVWRFIMDREVEAPQRFCSIQTYRAAVAVMEQQVPAGPPRVQRSAVQADLSQLWLPADCAAGHRRLHPAGSSLLVGHMPPCHLLVGQQSRLLCYHPTHSVGS